MTKSAEAHRADLCHDCRQNDVFLHGHGSGLLRRRMKPKLLLLLLVPLLFLQTSSAISTDPSQFQDYLTRNIPPRSLLAMTGSEFAKAISSMDGFIREQAILTQLMQGNLPDFLRKLKPVQMSLGSKDGRSITVSIFVMPDYLAVGSDSDFLLIPMTLHTATQIALRFGFILPTKKMVDAIFNQSAFHLTPAPLPPGPQMRSTAYYVRHDERIKEQEQTLGKPLDALVSGHKKDVVLTNRLVKAVGRIAIYGWHRLSGVPIQPLTTVHPASYADYSHGIRLVSEIVLINGKPKSIYSVLQDPEVTDVLSDEGVMQARQLLSSSYSAHESE